jgi:hypothetical protein
MNTSVKVLQIALKVLLIFLPGQSIYAGSCVFPYTEERIIE